MLTLRKSEALYVLAWSGCSERELQVIRLTGELQVARAVAIIILALGKIARLIVSNLHASVAQTGAESRIPGAVVDAVLQKGRL